MKADGRACVPTYGERDGVRRVIGIHSWTFNGAACTNGLDTRVDLYRDFIADFIADAIWSLRFTEFTSFDLACADWATRLAIARHCEKEIRAQGVTAERAAAEALTIIEVVGEAEAWRDVVSKNMRV